MITVKDIFNFPEMKNGVVRAGKMGLNRPIHWVHVIDHEDMGNFLEGGEFLLASGQIWSDDPEAARQLLKTLLAKHVAGIVFATGRYLTEVPKEALEFGDEYSIPIIEVPFHISFVKVTRSIHKAILNQSQPSLQSSDHIPIDLIEAIKTVDSITEICRTLASHLNSYVLITDLHHRILTKSTPKNTKHIKNSTIINKLREIIEMKLYKESIQTVLFEPNEVTFIPSKKPPYVLLIPLQITENNEFTFWILDPYRPLGKSEEKIAQYAAVLLKDSILNQKEAMAELTERRLEFLTLLFNGSRSELPRMKDKAREFGLYPVTNYIVGLIPLSHDFISEEAKFTLRDHCQKWLDEAPNISGFCENYQNELIIFASLTEDSSDYKSQFYNLNYHLQNIMENDNLILIMSRLQHKLFTFPEAYQETKILLPIVQSSQKSDSTYFSEQLQREMLLYGQLSPEQAQMIQNLTLPKELLSKKENFLYETLKYLAKYDFNREQTAKAMHIHRNTLRYRVNRLEKLLNDDLSSSECQFWIRVALDLETMALTHFK